MRKTFLAFGDVHIPHQNKVAVDIVRNVVASVKPDLVVVMGDLLDCGQFSVYPPTYGTPETDYEADLEQAKELLDDLQENCQRLVLIEGNHEYRLDRWAASKAEGRGAYTLLAPHIQLMKRADDGEPRTRCTYVRYGSASGRYSHYKVNGRIVAVHGWSYARHATKQHLQISQGMSVLHGHTHRCDISIIQKVWHSGDVVQARSTGCLCRPIPLYGTGSPVEWVNAFVIGYLGRRSDTMYTVPILDDRCILPDGTEIKSDLLQPA